MSATPTIGAFTVMLPRASTYQQTASAINAACAHKQLPHAFEITPDTDNHKNLRIVAHPAFRFEGFGLALGFRPKLSFQVRYQPDSDAHVELGRFLAPICLSDFAKR